MEATVEATPIVVGVAVEMVRFVRVAVARAVGPVLGLQVDGKGLARVRVLSASPSTAVLACQQRWLRWRA